MTCSGDSLLVDILYADDGQTFDGCYEYSGDTYSGLPIYYNGDETFGVYASQSYDPVSSGVANISLR